MLHSLVERAGSPRTAAIVGLGYWAALRISDIELDAIQVTPQGIAVQGSGIVDLELIVARADGQEAHRQDAAFPRSFALTLNSVLDSTHASMLDLDRWRS